MVVDAGSLADAAAGDVRGTGGTGGIVAADAAGDAHGTGGTGGIVAADAAGDAPGPETGDSGGATDAAMADLALPQDVGLDAPFSPDTNLPPDLGLVTPDTAEAGAPDAPSADASDGPATGETGGTGDVGIDSAPAPVIISIDFVGGSPNGAAGASGTVAMEPSESAGVEPVTATHWNSAFGSTGNNLPLMSASGSSTTAFASWSVNAIDGAIDTWSNFFTDAPGDTRMMNGYLDPRAANYNATISVTGLPNPVSSGYDVYVYLYSYMPGVETRLYQYNIGATTYSVTQTGPSAGACPAYRLASGADAGAAGEGNYVVFHNLNGDHFTLTALPAQNSSGQQRAPVNGIQIVYPSGY
jgi:hypothetical protein